MKYFSGFALAGEAALFDEFIAPFAENRYVVVGFSYGAIKAVEYAYASRRRVEKLILLSPALFLNSSKAFKKVQLLHFKKDPGKYIDTFLSNAAYPASKDILEPYLATPSIRDLEELLEYSWPKERLESLLRRGTTIETYIGKEDKIVDAEAAFGFFREFGESYLFKQYGHILHRGGESG